MGGTTPFLPNVSGPDTQSIAAHRFVQNREIPPENKDLSQERRLLISNSFIHPSIASSQCVKNLDRLTILDNRRSLRLIQ